MVDNLYEALARLRENNLVVELRQGSRTEIFGGSECSASIGIVVYAHAFSITLEGGVWIARTSGGGQQVNEFAAATLDDAVAFIIANHGAMVDTHNVPPP